MDSSQLTTGTGYTKINGVDYLQLFDTEGNQYTVRPENGLGYVYDDQNKFYHHHQNKSTINTGYSIHVIPLYQDYLSTYRYFLYSDHLNKDYDFKSK